MMQNKCVVKGEKKKKTTKRKRDGSPTSESSCGVFAAVNPWVLGNFSPGELQYQEHSVLPSAGLRPLAAEMTESVGLLCTERR